MVLGYSIGHQIGEGASASVCLGYKDDGSCIAIKILEKGKLQDISLAKKEFKIHHSVTHKNIIKVFACTEDKSSIYILMEYAQAGELFERIEPDVGVGPEVAHFYINQLLNAVDCIHDLGIAHRDLKPENILLDSCGNLKLSDFGLATVFRHKGSERILKTPCGSPPYLAPEIRNMAYEGPQVDIWSCGIILFVLLVGNTAWTEPTLKDPEFATYLQHYPDNLRSLREWGSLEPIVLGWKTFANIMSDLILGILNVEPGKRFTSSDIRRQTWFAMENSLLGKDGMCTDPKALAELLKSKIEIDYSADAIAYSQPANLGLEDTEMFQESDTSIPRIESYSQPAALDLGEDSQSPVHFRKQINTQLSMRGVFIDLFPSNQMTRFFSPFSSQDILQRLAETFQEFLVPCRIMGAFKVGF